jgi:hypothetical protein
VVRASQTFCCGCARSRVRVIAFGMGMIKLLSQLFGCDETIATFWLRQPPDVCGQSAKNCV